MDWPICQLPFRLLSQCQFTLVPQLRSYFTWEFTRIGDSKANEETNKIVRRIEEKEKDDKVTSNMRIYQALAGHDSLSHTEQVRQHLWWATGPGDNPIKHTTLTKTPLDWQGIRHACVSSDTFYEAEPYLVMAPENGWAKAFDAKAVVMPRSWNVDNVMDHRKTYVSKNPQDTRYSIAAGMAMLTLHDAQAWRHADGRLVP